RRPFSNAIHTQDSGLLVGRGEKGRCRMRFMVFAEQELRNVLFVQTRSASQDLFAKKVSQQQFLFQPHRHGGKKGLQATRRKADVGFKQPLEFDQRLVIKHNILKVLNPNPSLVQTILNRAMRKSRIMLLSCKSFFLCRSDDLAVPHEAGGAVVVEGGNAENIHSESSPAGCFKTLTRQTIDHRPWPSATRIHRHSWHFPRASSTCLSPERREWLSQLLKSRTRAYVVECEIQSRGRGWGSWVNTVRLCPPIPPSCGQWGSCRIGGYRVDSIRKARIAKA